MSGVARQRRVSTNQRWLSITTWVSSTSVILTSVLTFVVWAAGPPPQKTENPQGLWPEQAVNAVQEPTDRLILLTWFVIPIILLVLARLAARQMPRPPGRWLLAIQFVILGVSLIIIVRTVTLANDPWGYWVGLSFADLAIGTAITSVAFVSWRLFGASRRILLGLTLLTVLAFLGPALLNSPEHVRDSYNFSFTSDEMAAPAAGKFPLVNYVPQYSNLLGYPIAPILLASPENASWIVLGWFLLLQMLLIVTIVSLPLFLGGSRLLTSSLLLLIPPLIMVGANSPISLVANFTAFPLRTLLPVLLIVAAVWLVPKLADLHLGTPLVVLLGLGAGMAALNNVDYGLPAAVAVAIVLTLSRGRLCMRFLRVGVFVAAATAVALTYAVVHSVLGNSVSWPLAALYLQTFAIGGFSSVPMDPIGLHVLAVGLFASAIAVGFLLMCRPVIHRSQQQSRLAIALIASGSWGLLTMTYFAGRSLVPTLLGGTLTQIALVSGAFLPLIQISLRRFMQTTGASRAVLVSPIALGAILCVFLGALWGYTRGPKDSLTDYLDAPLGTPIVYASEVQQAVRDVQNERAEVPTTYQMLPGSHLIERELNWSSALALNSPEAFTISPVFTTYQCSMIPEDATYIAIDQSPGDFLLRDDSCLAALDVSQIEPISIGDRLIYLVPVR